MAATHRILDELYEESFTLIAIHSSLEDYSLAYVLNQSLKSKFKRMKSDLDLARGQSYPIFEWKDEKSDSYWTLMSNKCRQEGTMLGNDLFMNEPSVTTFHLIPENKEVDYFLKIDGEATGEEDNLLKVLTGIPKVITAYAIDTDNLKSKRNLIF